MFYRSLISDMDTMAAKEDRGEVFWRKQTVPAINKYLKDHGIPFGKRRKPELIGLAVRVRKTPIRSD